MIQYSTDKWERPLSANIAQNVASTLGPDSLIVESGVTIYEAGKEIGRMQYHVHPKGWV